MPETLRIGQFTNVYRPVGNGVVTSVATFRAELTRMGHAVFLFGPEARGYVDDEPYVFRYPSLGIPGQMYPLTIPVSPMVDWLIPHLKLDVLHSNHPFLLGRVAARKARQEHLPLVFTFHTRYREYSHYVPALPTAMVQDFIDGWVGHYLENCNVVVVPSQSIADLLRERYTITEGVHVVPTGIDLSCWTPSQVPREAAKGERLLVSAGRLAEEKNWETLIRAVARVRETVPGVRLRILGEGAHRPVLEKLVQELGVGENVALAGQVPPAELPDLFRAAELFCFASITETQGLVTLEAMATGLPVAAVEASGTSDVVTDGSNGFLTANEPEALALAILKILEDPDLQARMAAESLQAAASYDCVKTARSMLEVYAEAIERHKQGKLLMPVRTNRVPFEERFRKFLVGEW